MSTVATAALPVAIGLLVFAALARAIVWTGFGDEQARETARRHLEPLCVWCLGALGVYVFAHSAGGGSCSRTTSSPRRALVGQCTSRAGSPGT